MFVYIMKIYGFLDTIFIGISNSFILEVSFYTLLNILKEDRKESDVKIRGVSKERSPILNYILESVSFIRRRKFAA